MSVHVTSGPDPLYEGCHDAGTSMNASIAAQFILRGWSRPGVRAPEEFFDVEDYFAELKKRRFTVAVTFVVH